MAEDLLIKLDRISKSYQHPSGRIQVLKEVSLALNCGDTVAVTGPSGSGKSTLLNITGGLDRPDIGDVLFDQKSLSDLSESELDRFRLLRIGFVFQDHHLLPQCTARENVLLPTLPTECNCEQVAVRAEELLALAGLDKRMDHFPGELSGGECQRVAVCRALINSPDLLLADEPTGALDRKTSQSLLDVILKLAGDHMSVLMVTHSEAAAARMMRRYELIDGKLLEH